MASERVIAEILNQAAAVRVSVGSLELLIGRGRKALPQSRFHGIAPHRIDNGFMGEYRITRRNGSEQRKKEPQRRAKARHETHAHVTSSYVAVCRRSRNRR